MHHKVVTSRPRMQMQDRPQTSRPLDANAGQTTDQQTTDANAGQTTDTNADQSQQQSPQAPAEYQVVTKDVVVCDGASTDAKELGLLKEQVTYKHMAQRATGL